jgi:hypothetical protein
MAGGAAGPAKETADSALGRGVLHQRVAATRFTLTRHEPSAAMAPFVDFYWILRWDLRGRPPHEQTILPHPNVNLAFEQAGAAIYGVDRQLFVRRIEGQGAALGVRFPTTSASAPSGSCAGPGCRRRPSGPSAAVRLTGPHWLLTSATQTRRTSPATSPQRSVFRPPVMSQSPQQHLKSPGRSHSMSAATAGIAGSPGRKGGWP